MGGSRRARAYLMARSVLGGVRQREERGRRGVGGVCWTEERKAEGVRNGEGVGACEVA